MAVMLAGVVSRLAGWNTVIGPGAVMLAVSLLWSESSLVSILREKPPISAQSKLCGPSRASFT